MLNNLLTRTRGQGFPPPSSKALQAFLRKERKKLDSDVDKYQGSDVGWYQDSDNDEYTAPLQRRFRPPINQDSDVIREFSVPSLQFHPTLPQIVYSYNSGTYLWNFCSLLHSTIYEAYQEHVQIYNAPLSGIRIADSGNLIYGFEHIDGEEKVAVLSLADYQQIFGKPRVLPTRPQVLHTANSVVQHLGELDKAGLVRENLSQAQSGGTAMLVKATSGSPAISILRQTPHDGSLVQETIDCHGDISSRTLLHLPSCIAGNTDVTLLSTGKHRAQHEPERVRVLLGVQPKDSYSFKRQDDTIAEVSLPVMFERETSSIRVAERGLQRSIENCTSSFSSLPTNEVSNVKVTSSKSEDEGNIEENIPPPLNIEA